MSNEPDQLARMADNYAEPLQPVIRDYIEAKRQWMSVAETDLNVRWQEAERHNPFASKNKIQDLPLGGFTGLPRSLPLSRLPKDKQQTVTAAYEHFLKAEQTFKAERHAKHAHIIRMEHPRAGEGTHMALRQSEAGRQALRQAKDSLIKAYPEEDFNVTSGFLADEPDTQYIPRHVNSPKAHRMVENAYASYIIGQIQKKADANAELSFVERDKKAVADTLAALGTSYTDLETLVKKSAANPSSFRQKISGHAYFSGDTEVKLSELMQQAQILGRKRGLPETVIRTVTGELRHRLEKTQEAAAIHPLPMEMEKIPQQKRLQQAIQHAQDQSYLPAIPEGYHAPATGGYVLQVASKERS